MVSLVPEAVTSKMLKKFMYGTVAAPEASSTTCWVAASRAGIFAARQITSSRTNNIPAIINLTFPPKKRLRTPTPGSLDSKDRLRRGVGGVGVLESDDNPVFESRPPPCPPP